MEYSKGTVRKLRPFFSFSTLKIRGGVGEMFESILHVWPRTEPFSLLTGRGAPRSVRLEVPLKGPVK